MRRGHRDRRHHKRGRTNEARPLRQEAQIRRQGHWEGGQGLECRKQGQAVRTQDQLQTQPGPYKITKVTKTPGKNCRCRGNYEGAPGPGVKDEQGSVTSRGVTKYLIKDEDWALLVDGGLFLIFLLLSRVHRLFTGTRSTSLSPVNNVSLEAIQVGKKDGEEANERRAAMKPLPAAYNGISMNPRAGGSGRADSSAIRAEDPLYPNTPRLGPSIIIASLSQGETPPG
ncbi:hypothetical protein EYF80_008988 [Liparis tanakae]|uniref:Uncharacterized protein n=1 Tax=Liparis tanakae TaxID=230148 RepID=A0A4Z2ITB7_9TELE|nr:hypothetical protein EYF80_008988 [Liparis tanakae]